MKPNDKLPEDELPVQLLECIAIEAQDVTEEKSKGASKDFKLGFQHGYFIGATAWAPWKVKHDEILLQLQAQDANVEILLAQKNDLHKQVQRMANALEGCIGTIIFWYEVLSQTEGFGVMEAEYLKAKNQSIKRIETALQQFKDGKKEGGCN